MSRWSRDGWFESAEHQEAVRRLLDEQPKLGPSSAAAAVAPSPGSPSRPSPPAPPVAHTTVSLAVGDGRYLVRWIKGNPYLYRREYLGAKAHSRPRYRHIYLGRVARETVKDDQALRASIGAAERRRARRH
jgi:hypothetical protein